MIMYKFKNTIVPFASCVLYLMGLYKEMSYMLTTYYVLHMIPTLIYYDVSIVIHHILAIAMCISTFINGIQEHHANIVALLELTTIVVNLYHENIISRELLSVIYIPIRCIWIPNILLSNLNIDTNYFGTSMLILIIMGSYWWSYKMIKKLVYNPICLMGVLQYAQTWLMYNSIGSLGTLIFGIIFNTTGNEYAQYFDIMWNFMYGLYINMTTNSKVVNLLSLLACLEFCTNESNLYHVIFVQTIGNLCLYLYYTNAVDFEAKTWVL